METYKKFKHEKEGNRLRIWRTYQAPKEHIWQAITDHKILDQWWAPQPWSCHTKSHDFREGGHWHYAMQGPEGEKHWAMAKYLEIVPGTSYTADDFFSDEKGNKNEKLPSSRWNVALEADGRDTVMITTCTYSDEKTLEEYLKMGFLEGYEMGLNNLEQLLLEKSKN
ncbi:MAG: SRPBCC family protein [Sphingobacterium sp.]